MIRRSFTLRIRPATRKQLAWLTIDQGISPRVALRTFMRDLLEGIVAMNAPELSLDGQAPGLTSTQAKPKAAKRKKLKTR